MRSACSRNSARAVVDRRRLALAAALALAGTLSARAAPQTHTITIDAMRFVPQTLSVQRGDRVVWINKDLFAHTATATAGTFESGSIASNASWTHVARVPGTHAYLCSLHTTMTGTLTIR
jgi:plastocyanin